MSIVPVREENALWATGVLGTSNSTALLCAVFFFNGANFCLRGGSERRNLKVSQFHCFSNPDWYLITILDFFNCLVSA